MSEAVTWLLPVKNAMPYLTQALASIQAQTYRNWEVLAWDNGSTDGSVDELHRWIPSRLPGRVVAGRPMGLGASLAQMVQQASTQFCARMDGDDVNEPNRLTRQVAYLRDHAEIGVVGSNIQFISDRGSARPGASSVCTHDAAIRWRLRFCNAMNHPTVVFRRSVVLAAGNYRDLTPGQDYDLWARVAGLAAMANLPDRLLNYRLLSTSIGARHRGVTDPLHRAIVQKYASNLFPGITVDQALRLWQLIRDPSDTDVTLQDCLHLGRTASQAANRIGQDPAYFRRTESYQVQRRSLWLRWIKRLPGGAAAWPVLGGVRRWRARNQAIGGAGHELG